MPAPLHACSTRAPCVTIIDPVSASLIEISFPGFAADWKLPTRVQRWFTESVCVGLQPSAKLPPLQKRTCRVIVSPRVVYAIQPNHPSASGPPQVTVRELAPEPALLRPSTNVDDPALMCSSKLSFSWNWLTSDAMLSPASLATISSISLVVTALPESTTEFGLQAR